VTSFPPNDRHEDPLRRAEAAARAEGAGLWSACPAP
jgi:endonuclease YncB( thermonuclease family)